MLEISAEFIQEATKTHAYTELHQAMLDLIISVRSIKQSHLLLYLKKALVTYFLIMSEMPAEEHQDYLWENGDSNADLLPEVTADTLSNVIGSINSKLAPLDFEITESNDMDDVSVKLFSFVNTKAAGSIRLSTKYTDSEIQIVKGILDRIFNVKYSVQNDDLETAVQLNYVVPYMKLVRHITGGSATIPDIRDSQEGFEPVTSGLPRLSLEEAENFLKDLEYDGWLERYKDGYTLSSRGLVELKKYLVDTYGKSPEGSISICGGCADILTRGLVCPNPECHMRFHSSCRDLVQKKNNSNKCPNHTCTQSLDSYGEF